MHLSAALQLAWNHGWQPADLIWCVRRRQGAKYAALAAEAVTDHLHAFAASTVDPRWHAQVAKADAPPWWPPGTSLPQAYVQRQGWTTFVPRLLILVAVILELPPLERLGPLPGQYQPIPSGEGSGASAVDPRVLRRIKGLLAKAEACTSTAEAEAFSAGAHERMARHRIDHAMLQATSASHTRAGQSWVGAEKPQARRIWLEPPYVAAQTLLLHGIAGANGCRGVYNRQLSYCTVMGFGHDLDVVEMLFDSLLEQATSALARLGDSEQPAEVRQRTRSLHFRRSFLTAYAVRIKQRLSQITDEQTEAAGKQVGQERLLPVLASRQQAVDHHVDLLFPHTRPGASLTIHDRWGWDRGQHAAQHADTSAHPRT
nr:DUF2786 domain-containing protein [Kineosporia babensis]